MQGVWNVDFTKRVPEGAAGNQAYYGIFYRDDTGAIRRLVQAEGLTVTYNPETEDINPIGFEAAETLLRNYRVTIDNSIIIRKGEENYEFFDNWRRLRPTGENAKLDIFLVDFKLDEVGTNHNRYYAESFDATCTVESSDETGARLSINFAQAGSITIGVMRRTDNSQVSDPSTFVYGFTPSEAIRITNIDASEEVLEVNIGETKWVHIGFAPLACPFDFKYEVNAMGRNNIDVSRRRQSLLITGRNAGDATVVVTSVADQTKSLDIVVTVDD